MSPAERHRVDRLLLAAAALEPDDRTTFLARLGVEERTVADEVRRRLRAAGELPDGFLVTPATGVLEAACAEPADETLDPPADDERYEVGECLGAGGMARVYRAFDRRLDRTVALKILSATDPATPARLLREARAQARVRHPHVLEVYDTGEIGGRRYISMRHVAGGTLGDLGRAVGLEQRVRLMAQVAEGLHAAHREGLLHGDVKPSNVLVEETADGELMARIGDFGIATELERGDGGAAAISGTPEFMAPEVLRGEPGAADRRSDVYSLGVTLRRVLSAGTPSPGGGAGDRRRRGLPPELAAVVARCVAENPADRYPSARAVAADLRRFLDGEVVEAYADRLTYRLTRFAARHRKLLAGAAVSALVLALALVVAAAMGVRAVRANRLADQRRVQAEELIGFTLLDLRDKLEPVGRLDLLEDVGERAMRYFAAVPESALTDEELARRSQALYQIGDVRMRRGDLAGAERPFAESLALARQLAERDPGNAERLFGLGQSEFWAGYALWERGELAAARRHFEAYRAIAERLVARDPSNLDWQLELSYAGSNLGSVLQKQGDLKAALGAFRSVLAIHRRLLVEAPDHPDAAIWRFELAASHNTVAVVLEEMGLADEAREHFEAELALRRELAAGDPENQRHREFLGTSHQYLGNLLLARGDLAAARPHLEAARDLFEQLGVRDADNEDWRYKAAWSHLQLGRLERATERHEHARQAWERADEIARDLARTSPERVDRRLLLGAARHHLALGRARDGAIEAERQAIEVLASLAADQPADRRVTRWLAESLLHLGLLEAEAGDADAALRSWRRAVEVLAPVVGEGTRDHRLLAPWARALERVGRHREALEARATLARFGYREAASGGEPGAAILPSRAFRGTFRRASRGGAAETPTQRARRHR